MFPYLMLAHRGRDIACVNAAVDSEPKMVRFWESGGDQVGTTEITHRDQWAKGNGTQYTPFWLRAVTFEQLLDAFPGPYRLVSIDTEGSNLRVLKSCPLERMQVELVCVEREPGDEMMKYLESIGYGNIRKTQGDYLASRR